MDLIDAAARRIDAVMDLINADLPQLIDTKARDTKARERDL